MKYQSTRSANTTANSTQAVLQGLANDGGLYISPEIATTPFDWKGCLGCDTMTMAEKILHHLLPDFDDMPALVRRSYEGKFETEDLTPLKKVGDRYVLELFRGPTSAFKDVALSVLPQLITSARRIENIPEETVILTATSGDTGKAALEGFHDVDGTKIIVFYPEGGVSAVQQLQMTTQEGKNVCVCAVRGNFDDAQTGVKNVFSQCADMTLPGAKLSSANSINIGRLAPQITYYFKAYSDLLDEGRIQLGELVHFVVPTGNFGDILAGYFAKLMGLPVGKLVCASNQNDVLNDFIKTGTYDKRRTFYKTSSPSMDILVSSNLERLLYLLSGDEKYVASLMGALRSVGHYTLRPDLLDKLQSEFGCGTCDDKASGETIGKVFKEENYLMDPHTSVGWNVADQFMATVSDNAPVVVLSTASPYKFPVAVLSALGEEAVGDEFAIMNRLQEVSGVPAPKNLATLQGKEVRHKDVINQDEMLSYVLGKIEKWN